MSYQSQFIEKLKEIVPSNKAVADEIAELLSISKDSAYRRLRNETPFTLNETIILCKAFHLSLDEFFGSPNKAVAFNHNHLFEDHNGFLEYLKHITVILDEVAKMGGKIIYAAEDIPMFLHFEFPNLLSFKLFYWMKAILGSPMYEGKLFASELIHPDLKAQALTTLNAYNGTHSTEIWTTESINSTLRQIMYYVESYQFDSEETALAVIDDLKQLINGVERKAKNGSKLIDQPDLENYTLFDSEVLIGNNTVLIEGLQQPLVFLSHNTFNTINTTNQNFYNDTKQWTDNLISKSTMISGVSEKHRMKFFKRVSHSIELTRKKIELFYA